MGLDGAGDDLSGASGETIDQDDQGEIVAAVAARGHVALFARGAAAVRNDELALLQEHVGYIDALGEQAARIVAQIEDQTLERAGIELAEPIAKFLRGGFIKAGNAEVA